MGRDAIAESTASRFGHIDRGDFKLVTVAEAMLFRIRLPAETAHAVQTTTGAFAEESC